MFIHSFTFAWLTWLRTFSLGCRLTVYLLHFVHAAAMLVLGATLPISLFYQVLWGLVGGPALTNVSTTPHRTAPHAAAITPCTPRRSPS